MDKRIKSIIKTSRGSVSVKHAEYTNTTNNPLVNSSNYLRKSSEVERTITQYKGDSSVHKKVDPKSGIKYPYDNIIKFVRSLPYSFRGCFVCGK